MGEGDTGKKGPKRTVRDVLDAAGAASALEVAGHGRGGVGPHLDARAVAGVVHADLADEDVLDDVELARVLAQRADADAVAAVAVEALDYDVGAVRLE